ncbi:glycosyltransferase family 2 protein [Anoxybacillus ayderensis]|uniref:glycosyltransferase family 2 protein n=1 Tax=Anoxybacillus ayderensis TaxID=265546 RepID=UPI002E21A8B0|nr:glycosyltransferase family 2 protein [Anoxybacillus ayderensis]
MRDQSLNKNYKYPLVSIITVCFNSVTAIEDTIISVINQNYENIEYIIIDGGSTDGTIDIIKKYEKYISKWISESDNGIYDAMNKGIELSTGDWIIFMNAGDIFYDKDVISQIFNRDVSEFDFIYGDCHVRYDNGFSRVKRAGKISDMWKGMIFSHQAVFIKNNLMKEHKYNIKNKIGADFEFIYKMYRHGAKFLYSDKIIASISAGGLSDTARIESIKSHWNSVKRFDPSIKINIYYLYLIIDEIFRRAIKTILPNKIKNQILRFKYRKDSKIEDVYYE